MGIDDPGLWTTVLIGVTGLGTAIFRLIQAKIQADRDTRIAAMAFRGTKPHERPEILDGLAKLRSFHPGGPPKPDSEDPAGVLAHIPKPIRRTRR